MRGPAQAFPMKPSPRALRRHAGGMWPNIGCRPMRFPNITRAVRARDANAISSTGRDRICRASSPVPRPARYRRSETRDRNREGVPERGLMRVEHRRRCRHRHRLQQRELADEFLLMVTCGSPRASSPRYDGRAIPSPAVRSLRVRDLDPSGGRRHIGGDAGGRLPSPRPAFPCLMRWWRTWRLSRKKLLRPQTLRRPAMAGVLRRFPRA